MEPVTLQGLDSAYKPYCGLRLIILTLPMCYKPGQVLPDYNGLCADIIRYEASLIFPTLDARR
jgi:hypothetical protein